MEEKPKRTAKIIAFPPLIITTRMVKDVAGISRNLALELEKKGLFPKRRHVLGSKRVGWALVDIRKWAENLPYIGED